MRDLAGLSTGGVALIGGRYELVRELGTHGDVIDWEAVDSTLQRRVLLGLLRPQLVDDHAAAERFWQATRSAARFKLAAGERVLDGGTDSESGRLFVVREWRTDSSALDGNTVALPVSRRVDRLAGSFHLQTGLITLIGLILVAVAGGLLVRTGVEGWLAWVNQPLDQVSRNFLPAPVARPPAVGAQSGAATQTPVSPPPTVAGIAPATVKQTAPPSPTPRVTAPDSSTGVPRRIVNTDGRGVALRATPGGDRQPGKGYDEGATVSALESSGEWTRIRGGDGREGWVLSVTLAP
jgi:SH3-like domain-containing protein